MTSIFEDYWQAYLWSDGPHFSGLAVTLWLLILSVVIGFLLAVPLWITGICTVALARSGLHAWLACAIVGALLGLLVLA